MPRWQAVEGLVGAGKTTTVEILASRRETPAIFERADEHPLLRSYHDSPPAYALETELIFMAMHRHDVRRARDLDPILTDFSPAKDVVFAGPFVSSDVLDLLERVARALWRETPGPNVTVFLDVPVAECVRRIQRRGREYEAAMTPHFLEQLRESYLSRFVTLGAVVKKLDLDGTESPAEVANAVSGLFAAS
jgi:deoxyadenosine/deoxycytidine kinase